MNPSIFSPASHVFRHGFYLRVVVLCCLLLWTLSVIADWHGDLSVLSDYVYRGYSKSQSRPVVQGHLDYEADDGWFTGIGMSQVSFDDRPNSEHADLEFKPYLGWHQPLSADWRTELSVTGYIYNDKVFAQDANYVEFYATLHFQDWLSGVVSVAPDAYQRHATVLNYEVNYRRDIFDSLRFSAGLGYHQAKALLEEEYFYWNVGASWFLTSYLAADVRYVDVALDRKRYTELHFDEFYPRLLESKFLLSITLGF